MGKHDPAPTAAAGLVRTARARAGLTQAALAGLTGVTQQAISAYETGRKEPTLPTLQRMITAAGFEMRIRLEPLDRDDETLEDFLNSLPAQGRADLDRARRDRAAAARPRRVRGR